MKECNILVSIDVIFDTLLGCVESINSEWANKLKSNKDYYTRKSNKLSLIVPFWTFHKYIPASGSEPEFMRLHPSILK